MMKNLRPEDKPVILIQLANVLVGGLILFLSFGLAPLKAILVSGGILTGLRLIRLTKAGQSLACIMAHLMEEPVNEEDRIRKSKAMKEVLIPALSNVIKKSEQLSGPLDRSIRFRIINRDEKNAFVFCRKNVCITERLLAEEPDCLEAVLMHEIGHLRDKSTLLEEWNAAGELMIAICNQLPRAACLIKLIKTAALALLGRPQAALSSLTMAGFFLLLSLSVTLVLGAWYRIRLPYMLEYRKGCERAADRYVILSGLGDRLQTAIERLSIPESLLCGEKRYIAGLSTFSGNMR